MRMPTIFTKIINGEIPAQSRLIIHSVLGELVYDELILNNRIVMPSIINSGIYILSVLNKEEVLLQQRVVRE